MFRFRLYKQLQRLSSYQYLYVAECLSVEPIAPEQVQRELERPYERDFIRGNPSGPTLGARKNNVGYMWCNNDPVETRGEDSLNIQILNTLILMSRLDSKATEFNLFQFVEVENKPYTVPSIPDKNLDAQLS